MCPVNFGDINKFYLNQIMFTYFIVLQLGDYKKAMSNNSSLYPWNIFYWS